MLPFTSESPSRASWLALALWLLVLSGPVALASSSYLVPLRSSQLRDLDAARSAARGRLVQSLEELVEWCTKKKLYASRVGVYESLLHFQPEHTAALRGLGYKKGRKGEWLPPKQRKPPKNWNKSAERRFPKQRSAVVTTYRDEMLILLEEHAAGIDAADRSAIYADILFADPDDARVHELLGEVRVDGVWVLAQSARSKSRRQAMRMLVTQAFADAPQPSASAANEAELALGIKWTAVFEADGVRSLGTGEEEEVMRLPIAMHATRSYFNAVLGAKAAYPDPLTVYTLPRASDKLAFLMGHPAIDETYRKYLMALDGSGIRGSGDFAHWAPDPVRRLDGLVRQSISWLLTGGFGIKPAHGWAFEGFGLYLTRELVGTRLTWFVRESKYLTPEEDQALKARLLDSRANWMDEAFQMFATGKPIKLQFLLGKSVNSLDARDMLYSYCLAAYMLEAEAQKLPQLLTAIGQGKTSQAAFQDVLGLDVRRLDERLRRWLSERR
jgi:hypothetical protein